MNEAGTAPHGGLALSARRAQLRAVVASAAFAWGLLGAVSLATGRLVAGSAQATGFAAALVVLSILERLDTPRRLAACVHGICFVGSLVVSWVTASTPTPALVPSLPALAVPSVVAYLLGPGEALAWAAISLVIAIGGALAGARGLLPHDGAATPMLTTAQFVLTHVVLVVMAVVTRRAYDDRARALALEAAARAAQADELSAARDVAVRASRAKSEFLATMSHELRTPMNGVLGMAEALLATPLPADQRAMVATLRQSGEALLAILNDVLDEAKLESGTLALVEEPFDVDACIESVRALFAPVALARGLSLTVRRDEGASAGLVGDVVRVRQILANLVGNALKFTQRGEVSVRVGASADGATVITVRDTGVGIPVARLDAIFQPFVQADATTTRRFGGTGLGLSIVRRLADAMGGRTEVESALGEGSTFRVTLPLPRCAAPVGTAKAAPAPAAASASRSLRVLVIEDHPINQEVARALLEGLGHEVVLADDGEAGVARACAERFDVIFTDVEMPGIDGFEVWRRLRAALPEDALPVTAAMTAHALAEHRARYAEVGLDFVAKPIAIDEIRRVLARAERR